MSPNDAAGFLGDLLKGGVRRGRRSNPHRGCGKRLKLLAMAVGQSVESALPRRVGWLAVAASWKHRPWSWNAVRGGSRVSAHLLNACAEGRFMPITNAPSQVARKLTVATVHGAPADGSVKPNLCSPSSQAEISCRVTTTSRVLVTRVPHTRSNSAMSPFRSSEFRMACAAVRSASS